MTSIVKIQAPLGSSEPDPPALMYDRNRAHTAFVPLGDLPEHVRRALALRPKAYFTAKWSPDLKAWVVGEQVETQRW
jgi:hypothetical protein